MTLSTTGYTLGSNEPMNNARILYSTVTGAVTGSGATPELAANDYTFQRWVPGTGAVSWLLTLPVAADIDTVFIAAHSLSGKAVVIATSPDLAAGFTDRATISPTDNGTIAAMISDGSGNAISTRRLRISVDEGDDVTVGIIRAGVALQLTQAFYAGHTPTSINRVTQAKQQFSETGQWLGRQLMRQAVTGSYSWEHLRIGWYRTYFEPFAKTLPLYPFGIIGNPARFSDDVAWCWTDSDVAPETMGVNDYVSVSLAVTGVF